MRERNPVIAPRLLSKLEAARYSNTGIPNRMPALSLRASFPGRSPGRRGLIDWQLMPRLIGFLASLAGRTDE